VYKVSKTHWYPKIVSDVLSELDSLKEGLAEEQVAVRIEKFGLNDVTHDESPNLIFRFLYQFKSLLVLMEGVILTAPFRHSSLAYRSLLLIT
jgi:magnesium-transporting ATPase (P-type)